MEKSAIGRCKMKFDDIFDSDKFGSKLPTWLHWVLRVGLLALTLYLGYEAYVGGHTFWAFSALLFAIYQILIVLFRDWFEKELTEMLIRNN